MRFEAFWSRTWSGRRYRAWSAVCRKDLATKHWYIHCRITYIEKRFKKLLLAVVTALRAWVWSLTFSSFVIRLLNPIMLVYFQRYLLVSTLARHALSAYPEPVHMHQCKSYFVIILCVFLCATYYITFDDVTKILHFPPYVLRDQFIPVL
jgi:hypothetical protein